MRLGRLLVIALVVALAWWLLNRSGVFTMKPGSESATAPADRARTAAAASSGRAGETDTAQREADAPTAAGTISENMTSEQVRALLGAPDETTSETSETGGSRERWIYRRVGKTVVFENGIVVRIE
jgi:hypothetical protein